MLKVTSLSLRNSVALNAMWYSRLDGEQKKASVGKLGESQIMSRVS